MLGKQYYIWICASLLILFSIQVSRTNASVSDKDLLITANERVALEQFKKFAIPRVRLNFMKTDFYLIRWLRAKNLNVPQAETMLMQHLRWRQQNRIDTILQENWSDMEADYPYSMDTVDLKGKPVGTVEVYDWDVRRAILQGKGNRLLRFVYRLLEELTGHIYEAQLQGKNVTRFVVVGNADGFNSIQHACPLCLPLWIQFVRTFESNYPSLLDELIVVDATPTVNVILELILPIVSPETRNSIKVFGHNRDKWISYLDAKISPQQRRPIYGGTKAD